MASAFWDKIDLAQTMQMQRSLEKIGIVENEQVQSTGAAFAPKMVSVSPGDMFSARAHALASRLGVSVSTLVLSVWLVTLWRLGDESQIMIGVACDGRDYEELEEAPGLYTHFVPLEIYLEDGWSFEQVVGFVEASMRATREYQLYFSWPIASQRLRGSADPDVFPVLFEHERWPVSFASKDLELQFARRESCTEPFLLKLGLLQVGEQLFLELHYDAHNVSSARINSLASIVQTFLDSVLEHPQGQIGVLSLLSHEQRNHLLSISSASQRSWPRLGLYQLFEEQARRYAGHLAVLSRLESLTYQQLNERANQLARVLLRRGVGPGVLVGLCLPRQASMLVGLLGILKAGGAYLPLDAGSPAERLRYQLQESQAALLLTQEVLRAQLPTWEGQTLCLEELALEMAESATHDLSASLTGEELMAVIYTSGSTGRPKGVMVRQSSAVNYTLALCEQLGAEPGWHYATVSTLAADLGNTAIFCALASGGCVQVLDYETVTSSEAMAFWAAQHPIDVLKIVPSHLSALLEHARASELVPRRALVLGGEALSAQLVERVRQLGARCEVYNHYGPTETTIGVLVHKLDAQSTERVGTGKWLALGHPIANTQAYVLDRHLQVVPEGVTGEIYLGGAGVARGYLRQAAQTAERFVPHPYSQSAGERLYRTGDLGRYGPEGKIEFIGRSDGQVKLRGYRIEVGEIEAVLRQHLQVRDCVVALREEHASGPHLVGYIVPRTLSVVADMQLRDFLQERLPDYMLPSTYVYLKYLPLTANGKVDRRQLPAGNEEGGHALTSLIAITSPSRKIIKPRDIVEMQLLQIWEEILHLRPLSVVDNFFDVGGHSLLAVRLVSQITERFGRTLELSTLFRRPTIEELASVLRQQNAVEEEELLVALQAQGSQPPFFCVHPAGGTAFSYVDLARHLGSDQPFYGLHSPFGDQARHVGETAEELAARYVAAIQTVQPQGPYLLGGWSLGGTLAFEMAQQLQRAGHEVSVLAIFDSHISNPQGRGKTLAEGIDLGEANIVQDAISTLKVVPPDDFAQRALEEQFEYIVEQAKLTHIIPADTSSDLVRRYIRSKIMNQYLVHAYVGSDYGQKIDYFLCTGSTQPGQDLDAADTLAERNQEPAYLQTWRELARGGLKVHRISGSHGEMMDEPHVKMLAQILRRRIDEVCQQECF